MKAYFIGIGGIGVSALARYYLKKGWQVSGSDLVSSEITQALKKLGTKIYIGRHKTKNLSKDIDLVIYSPAVQLDNPELRTAKKLRIKYLSYPEALGGLTKEHFTIAIAGTHGKSTVTAMLGLLLVRAGLDPTVIVGTKVKEFGNSNCRVGDSKHLIIEACEHEESFLNYSSDIAVITNIEPEHLDYYKNFSNIKKAFSKFTQKLKKNGILITEKEYKSSKDAKKLRKILKVPGEHNIFNALATLTVARSLKIPDKISFKTLSEYRGCWRRFEIKKLEIGKQPYGESPKATRKLEIVDDYAHHPTEIKATLEAARQKWPKRKIWCIFQPHQYYRTHCLFSDFVKVLKTASINKIIITDIYDVAGREDKKIKEKINSQKLVKAINKPEVIYLLQEKIVSHLKKNLQGKEIIIIMGAGDIYKLKEKI